jgi:hypothetical protein
MNGQALREGREPWDNHDKLQMENLATIMTRLIVKGENLATIMTRLNVKGDDLATIMA